MGLVEVTKKIVSDHRFRFLLVGGFNTLFGFAVFVAVDYTVGRAIDRAGQGVVASVVDVLLSHILSSTLAFVLYRRFVFKVHGNLLIDFLRFQSVYLVSLIANTVLLPFLVAWGLPRIPTQAGLVLIMTIASYVGHRYFSFRRAPESAEKPDPTVSSPTPRRH